MMPAFICCEREMRQTDGVADTINAVSLSMIKNFQVNLIINLFKQRHRCREQTYGQQGGKVAGGWWWWCDELGDWD